MGTPPTTLYAAVAAFVAGIGATVAFVNFGAGGASDPSKASEAAVRSDPSPTVDRPWSNPPKTHASSTPASPKPRPTLRFDDAGADDRAASLPTRSAGVAIESEVRKAQGEPAIPEKAPLAQTQIELTPSMRTRVDMIRAERAAQQRARFDPSRTAGIETRVLETAPSADARTRTLPPRRVPLVEQGPARGPVAPRVVAKLPASDRQSLAADKEVRGIVTPTGGFRYADSHRIEAREPRKRVSSADAGGVMRWLMEPNGNF